MSVITVRTLTPTMARQPLPPNAPAPCGGFLARHGARVRFARGRRRDRPGAHQVDGGARARSRGDDGGSAGFAQRVCEFAPGYPVLLQREYSIARDKLAGALGLLPEIDALFHDHDSKVLAGVPVFSGDISRLVVAHYRRSRTHLGTLVGDVGLTKAFQDIVTRAAGFGSLTRSRVVVNL